MIEKNSYSFLNEHIKKSISGLCVSSVNQFPLCFLRILFQHCSLPERPRGLLLAKN